MKTRHKNHLLECDSWRYHTMCVLNSLTFRLARHKESVSIVDNFCRACQHYCCSRMGPKVTQRKSN